MTAESNESAVKRLPSGVPVAMAADSPLSFIVTRRSMNQQSKKSEAADPTARYINDAGQHAQIA